MDPLSVTASIIAILQLTTKVLSWISDTKGASKDCERCMLELTNSLSLLFSLKNRLESGNYGEPWFQSLRALTASNGPFDQYKNALEELQDGLAAESKATRLKQAVTWKLKKEEIASIISRMEHLKSLVQVALEMDHFKLSQSLKTDMQAVHDATQAVHDATQAVGQHTESLTKVEEARQQEHLTEWISTSNYPAQQLDTIRARQVGTGDWFLTAPQFQAWLNGSKQTIFCPGIPGSGKTMLSAIAIDHLTTVSSSIDAALAYVFCNYKSQGDQPVVGVLTAVLKQLVQGRPASSGPLRELYDQHASRKTRPSDEEVLTTLRSTLKYLPKTIIIVDALDEFPVAEGSRDRLLITLKDLQTKADICLMFTSRPIAAIERSFVGLPMLEIRADERDIRRYVAGRFGILAKCIKQDRGLQSEILEGIVQTVDGMFLLARLYTDSLQGKRTPAAVRKALKVLGRGKKDVSRLYDDAYDDALQRINEQISDDKDLALKVLGWITHARRLLRVEELPHALAVEPGDEELDREKFHDIEDAISVCAGLVTVDPESGIVRLVHYTTQEYFNRTRARWLQAAPVAIATTCLTYLMLSSFRDGPCAHEAAFRSTLQHYAFYRYASNHWEYHTALCEISVIEEASQFLKCSKAVRASLKALGGFWHSDHAEIEFSAWCESEPNQLGMSSEDTMIALHALARADLPLVAENVFPGPLQQDLLRMHCLYAHHSATWEGHWTPIQRAVQRNNIGITRWLLRKTIDFDDETKAWTLKEAASRGDEEMMKLLVEEVGGDTAEALVIASKEGHERVVKLLLKMGANVNASHDGYSALGCALRRRHEGIIDALVASGADVNEKCGLPTPALCMAADAGLQRTVNLLLDHSVDVNERGLRTGKTALHFALSRGNQHVANILLARGADANSQNEQGKTVLHYATKLNNKHVVDALLSKGVHINSQNERGYAALHQAAWKGQQTLVESLLEHGAEVNYQDKTGWTALHWAARRGHQQIVAVLIAHGADVNEPSRSGATALHLGAEYGQHGRQSLVETLLEHGADINSQDEDGRTALHHAAMNGNKSIIDILIIRGAEVDMFDFDGVTALHEAVYMGHQQTAELLLARGADVNAREEEDEAAVIHFAVRAGRKRIVELLIDKGADLNVLDGELQSPLKIAREEEHQHIVSLLLQAGATDGPGEND